MKGYHLVKKKIDKKIADTSFNSFMMEVLIIQKPVQWLYISIPSFFRGFWLTRMELMELTYWHSIAKWRIEDLQDAASIFHYTLQGFPQVLRTWGELFKIWWGGLSQFMGEAWGALKTLSRNTCEGVHLLVKLPAISLQASKFTKNELLHTYFSRILARL